MFSSFDMITEPLQSFLYDSPSPALIVPLKIPDILKDQVLGPMPFKHVNDLMK
jgi:hypothetical protein